MGKKKKEDRQECLSYNGHSETTFSMRRSGMNHIIATQMYSAIEILVIHERQRDGRGVNHHREDALEIRAHGKRQRGILPLQSDQAALQNVVGESRP